ncbi:MAG: hypothetical protein ACRECO_00750 [Xanthobacteraceae bacterium]
MANPEQFRIFADLCARMAKDVAVAEHREQFMEMRATWQQLADEAERFEQLVRDLDQAFDHAGAPPRERQRRSH